MKKKLTTICFLACVTCCLSVGCATTKVDHVTGKRVPTANTKHFQVVYKKPGGFYAGGKWVTLPKKKK